MSQLRDCVDHHEQINSDHHSGTDWQARAACDAQDTRRAESIQSRGTQPKPKEQEWTVAYYLGADKARLDPHASSAPSREHDLGGPEKAEQLKRLAAETKGKPVTAFVDVLRETDKAHADRVERLKRHDPNAAEPSGKPEDYVVDHYRLRDGKAERMGSDPSKGMAGDVEHLMHAASADPSKKLGLVINGDGGGNRGQKSDSSPLTSNDDVRSAIQRGLQGSGHERLDILNFDQCLMSQSGALDKFKDVTKDIVASSETERAADGRADGRRVDGQNLGAGLHDLLQKPTMDGRQWGDQIVADAAAGKNDIPAQKGESPNITDTGTSTLANIDTAKVGALTAAIDGLGKQLTAAVADPGNKEAVDDIIKSLPRLGTDGPGSESTFYQKRDLKAFDEALRKSIDSGKVTDPDGKLRQALDVVSAAQKDAVISYAGSPTGGYDKQGGLSVYLPDRDFRDVDKMLGAKTPLADAAQMLENFDRFAREPDRPAGDADKAASANGAYLNVTPLFRGLTADQKRQAQPVINLLEKLRHDTAAADRQHDLDQAVIAAHELLRSPLQSQLVAQMDRTREVQAQAHARDLELTSDPPGWTGFVQSMGWHA